VTDATTNLMDLKASQRGSAAARAASRDARPNEIPVIDMAGLRNAEDPEAIAGIAAQIAEACQRIGFFYAINHGVSQTDIDRGFDAAKRFFSLPLETRQDIKLNENHKGYLPLGDNAIPGYQANHLHSFEMAFDLPADDPDVRSGKPFHSCNVWPDLPGFRNDVETYFDQACQFGFHLLKAFAASLDLPLDFFQLLYEPKPLTSMRLLNYPPQHETESFGVAPHSDYGVITMLQQDETGGLELFSRDGEWIKAPVIPGAFVINIGDLMGLWTNDRYTSMQHRVISNPERERFSIPIFYNPCYDTSIKCLPSCMSAQNPARYEAEVMGEYLNANLSRTYKARKKIR
jgi:isopenicillin N synthase-like dioxygenase